MYILHVQDRGLPQEEIPRMKETELFRKGEYFLGQTRQISYSITKTGWGGLFNPPDSGVYLGLNAYTISNPSAYPLTVQGWLGSSFGKKGDKSCQIAAGNQSRPEPRKAKAQIQSMSGAVNFTMEGTCIFTRKAAPGTTLIKQGVQGRYIIIPGSSFVLSFLPMEENITQIKLAFDWWEAKNTDFKSPV